MRITQEGDYALRVLLYMYKAGTDKRIEAKVISEHENVPLRFLLKLLRKLTVSGIVKSYMGYGGGYAVAQPPDQVSVKAVLEAIEGPLTINKCFSDPELCNAGRASVCEMHKALGNVQDVLADELAKLTFDKLIK